ncbi:MFS transporter [Pseudoclavibacter chungangensis]|uniref:MFS transporter n=1 Tax=Pseudoclavibacter chungangensis TaxID=587635 RepID=A0A7J5BZV3_9MICO|nr:MFS transporter [Pseudoclavibacter chungangensis]KAB1659443.1 MFS transporter [Pseudoclavibacter chungangensis]NYJ67704.1 putative MFS family arabinose efflux permease [Pseudoclavibacter chungangensis]
MSSKTDSVPVVHAASHDAPTARSHRAGGLAWPGLIVMMATSFALVTAEFLPSGILTPMAESLGVTPGQAGQTVTVTAIVGFVVAPTIASLVPRLDRRTLLVWLAVIAAISNLGVALAPNLPVMLASRVLLGAALSGFWAMTLTIAATLASPERLGRAMSIVTLGTSVATVAGVPIAVVISTFADWRVVFFGAAAVTLVVAVALRFVLPPVPAAAGTGMRQLFETLRRPGIGLGLTGHVLTVLGQLAAYTFLRVALERVDGLDAAGVAVLLVVYGVGGFAGNLLIGALVDRHLRVLAFGVPAALALAILAVGLLAGTLPAVIAGVLVWGMGFGGWLVVVNTWLGHVVPDRLEAGGGLVVAGFQLAITLGAAVGGILIDIAGVPVTFTIAAIVLALGSVLFGLANRRVGLTDDAKPLDAPGTRAA